MDISKDFYKKLFKSPVYWGNIRISPLFGEFFACGSAKADFYNSQKLKIGLFDGIDCDLKVAVVRELLVCRGVNNLNSARAFREFIMRLPDIIEKQYGMEKV